MINFKMNELTHAVDTIRYQKFHDTAIAVNATCWLSGKTITFKINDFTYCYDLDLDQVTITDSDGLVIDSRIFDVDFDHTAMIDNV